MPRVHRCGAHDCRTIIPLGQRFCEKHQPERNPEADRQYNRRRKHENYRQEQIRFYHSRAWQHTRRAILSRDHGLCVYCSLRGLLTPATLVDHVVPREIAPELELEPGNLVGSCSACHRVKTLWEEQQYGTGKGNRIKQDALRLTKPEQLEPIFEKPGGLG